MGQEPDELAAAPPTRFDIVDTQGNVYYPIAVEPGAQPVRLDAPMDLLPSGTEPAPNTTMSEGPTQGGLLLFKLNNAVYSNRPLTLRHPRRRAAKPASISLDL